MGANFEAKKVLVDEIKNKIVNSKSIVVVNYGGINVVDDTELRKTCREAGVSYKVYKNRLMIKALAEAGYKDYDEKQFEGTTAIAFGTDETTAPKLMAKAVKDSKIKEIKFGFVDGSAVNAAGIERLATIPSKEVLIAMLMGMLKAPISALARGLNEIAKKNS